MPGPVTMQRENSDVLPAASVARAVMNLPSLRATGSATLKLALPVSSVATEVQPMGVWPSPYPLGSQASLT